MIMKRATHTTKVSLVYRVRTRQHTYSYKVTTLEQNTHEYDEGNEEEATSNTFHGVHGDLKLPSQTMMADHQILD